MRIAAAERIAKECDMKKQAKEQEWNDKIRRCQESLDQEKRALTKMQ